MYSPMSVTLISTGTVELTTDLPHPVDTVELTTDLPHPVDLEIVRKSCRPDQNPSRRIPPTTNCLAFSTWAGSIRSVPARSAIVRDTFARRSADRVERELPAMT